jgi:deferrochelatase/peroxidase EfeB
VDKALNPNAGDPSVNNPDLLNDDKINDFEYGDDPAGTTVPRAAHIRKAYPRDEVFLKADGTPDPNSLLNESSTQTHRILRRGIPYGTSFRPSLGAQSHGPKSVSDPDDRGLLFLCYQRSIKDQFEFIQTTWVNNADFPQTGDGQDPIIAQSSSGPFVCPVSKKNSPLTLNHFVTTTGGEYFFQPSISALKKLADGIL